MLGGRGETCVLSQEHRKTREKRIPIAVRETRYLLSYSILDQPWSTNSEEFFDEVHPLKSTRRLACSCTSTFHR